MRGDPRARRTPSPASRSRLPAVRLPARRAQPRSRARRSGVGAQNVHWEEKGAFTGEVSVDAGRRSARTYVIIGHSERAPVLRRDGRDREQALKAALAHGLMPIVCVGETRRAARGRPDARRARAPDARRPRRRRRRPGASSSPTSPSGPSAPASRPTARRPNEAIGFIRATVREIAGERSADAGAHPLRRLVTPRQHRRVRGAAGDRRRARRRRLAEGGRLRGDHRGRGGGGDRARLMRATARRDRRRDGDRQDGARASRWRERLGGEIVNADSRQVYRGMDIGTAKPTPAEQRGGAPPRSTSPTPTSRSASATSSTSRTRRWTTAGRAASCRSSRAARASTSGRCSRAGSVPRVPPDRALRARAGGARRDARARRAAATSCATSIPA